MSRPATVIYFLLVAIMAVDSQAQQISGKAPGDIDYAILLSLSEPVAFDGAAYVPQAHESATERRRREQASSAADRPAVPNFTTETETPERSRAIQLATAHRLRGETVAAAEAYATVLTLSRKPIHTFFYAEVARANGDVLLADHLASLYRSSQQSGAQLPRASAAGERTIRIAGVVTDASTGATLPNVEVRLLDPLAHREFTAQTDENGLFIVDGVSRRADLRIVSSAPGYVASQDALYVDPVHTAHAPIVGMRVYLQPEGGTTAAN